MKRPVIQLAGAAVFTVLVASCCSRKSPEAASQAPAPTGKESAVKDPVSSKKDKILSSRSGTGAQPPKIDDAPKSSPKTEPHASPRVLPAPRPDPGKTDKPTRSEAPGPVVQENPLEDEGYGKAGGRKGLKPPAQTDGAPKPDAPETPKP
jgi:hypothetical protein